MAFGIATVSYRYHLGERLSSSVCGRAKPSAADSSSIPGSGTGV